MHNVTRTLVIKKLETIKKMAGGLSDQINTPLMMLQMNMEMVREIVASDPDDTETILGMLDEMDEAYKKILDPMALVREKYWTIEEVSDGCGGTIYEIHEKPKKQEDDARPNLHLALKSVIIGFFLFQGRFVIRTIFVCGRKKAPALIAKDRYCLGKHNRFDVLSYIDAFPRQELI